MAKAKAAAETNITVAKIETGTLRVHILGREPLICNRMSEKARQELLAPRGRLSAVDKQTNQKHDPLTEYRSSIYKIIDDACPTLVGLPSTAFKGAMGTAALDLPGTKKAQIGRLTWVQGTYVPIFGVPQLFMSVVRSADMNRTPDIRTRAILPKWACVIDVTYVKPLMQDQAVANLLGAAGFTAGVGDWRNEKGKGNFGQFEIVDADNPDFLDIVAHGGRLAQLKAVETPVCFDDETADLLAWFHDEMGRRAQQGRIPKKPGKVAAAAANGNADASLQ